MSTGSEFADVFVRAMVSSDLGAIAASIDPEVQAYVTNASGGSDLVSGRQAFLARFPDFAAMADSFAATITQLHEIDDLTTLFMIEIEAERLGRSLHNFAGVLIRLSAGGTLLEYRMVEAQPEYSDEFWAATTRVG